ncbi:hypothetical protein M3J09_009485 [Ascochyta lentis]
MVRTAVLSHQGHWGCEVVRIQDWSSSTDKQMLFRPFKPTQDRGDCSISCLWLLLDRHFSPPWTGLISCIEFMQGRCGVARTPHSCMSSLMTTTPIPNHKLQLVRVGRERRSKPPGKDCVVTCHRDKRLPCKAATTKDLGC